MPRCSRPAYVVFLLFLRCPCVVLALSLRCPCVVLALSLRCPGVVLALSWRCPGVVLALSWRCPGVVCSSAWGATLVVSGAVVARSVRRAWCRLACVSHTCRRLREVTKQVICRAGGESLGVRRIFAARSSTGGRRDGCRGWRCRVLHNGSVTQVTASVTHVTASATQVTMSVTQIGDTSDSVGDISDAVEDMTPVTSIIRFGKTSLMLQMNSWRIADVT